MKHIPLLLVLGIALSLCNITNRFKQATTNSNNSGSSSSSTAETGGAAIEKAEPTAAQTAALDGGQEIKWNEQ